MKFKLVLVLVLLFMPTLNIYSMENIEDKLKEAPELKYIIPDMPSYEFIESWKIATGKLQSLKSIAGIRLGQRETDLEGKVPEELVEFCNKIKKMVIQIKLILACNTCSINKKTFFLNLVNNSNFYARPYFEELELKYFQAIEEYPLTDPMDLALFYQNGKYQQSLLNGILFEEIKSADKDSKKLVKLALSLGADPNAMSTESNTSAMTLCACNSQRNIMKVLLKSGAHVNAKNTYGNTPLILAVEYGNKEIIKMLLDVSAGVNAQNIHGCTALMKAAWKGEAQLVRSLLDAGADISLKSISQETALNFAQLFGHQNIVNMLKEADSTKSESKK